MECSIKTNAILFPRLNMRKSNIKKWKKDSDIYKKKNETRDIDFGPVGNSVSIFTVTTKSL